jgi:hypothetical protein
MIIEGNFRLTGLKQTDITPEIDNLIRSAKKFIVVCGYGFTNHTNVKSILGKIIGSPLPSKHCILPISLYKGKDANRSKALTLIQNGVSVSVEDKNHSKWMMSEREIYYGSANFTIDSLERKIEVATFRYFIKSDPIKEEFAKFIIESMDRMLSTSNRQKIRGYIRKNNLLTNSTRDQIKRLNPSIEKVVQTVDAINSVKSSIHEVLENSYWYLDDKHYHYLTQIAWRLEEEMREINFRGNELLNLSDGGSRYRSQVEKYNRQCDLYYGDVDRLQSVTSNLLNDVKNLPRFTKTNRSLLKLTRQVITLSSS